MISKKLISSLLKQTGNCHVKISVRFNSSEPLKTCLYDFHLASGGKMVDFAGLLMILWLTCSMLSVPMFWHIRLHDASPVFWQRCTSKSHPHQVEEVKCCIRKWRNHTIISRTNCSLFDVSHMLQTRVWGRDRVAFMESLTTADVEKMAESTGSLTVFTNEKGDMYE